MPAGLSCEAARIGEHFHADNQDGMKKPGPDTAAEQYSQGDFKKK
jgi:hypothetical protein